MKTKQHGLTLIEVLIALIICAIALLAVVKATNTSIQTFSYLKTKTLAMIAAENAMAKVQSGLIAAPTQNQSELLFGQTFFYSVEFNSTSTPHLFSVKISVKTKNSDMNIEKLLGYAIHT